MNEFTDAIIFIEKLRSRLEQGHPNTQHQLVLLIKFLEHKRCEMGQVAEAINALKMKLDETTKESNRRIEAYQNQMQHGVLDEADIAAINSVLKPDEQQPLGTETVIKPNPLT